MMRSVVRSTRARRCASRSARSRHCAAPLAVTSMTLSSPNPSSATLLDATPTLIATAASTTLYAMVSQFSSSPRRTSADRLPAMFPESISISPLTYSSTHSPSRRRQPIVLQLPREVRPLEGDALRRLLEVRGGGVAAVGVLVEEHGIAELLEPRHCLACVARMYPVVFRRRVDERLGIFLPRLQCLVRRVLRDPR